MNIYMATENIIRQFSYLPMFVYPYHLPNFPNFNQASVARPQRTAKVKTQQGSCSRRRFKGTPFWQRNKSHFGASKKKSWLMPTCSSGASWKISGNGVNPGRLTWNLQVTHLERKWSSKPPWSCSMLSFRDVHVRFLRVQVVFTVQNLARLSTTGSWFRQNVDQLTNKIIIYKKIAQTPNHTSLNKRTWDNQFWYKNNNKRHFYIVKRVTFPAGNLCCRCVRKPATPVVRSHWGPLTPRE